MNDSFEIGDKIAKIDIDKYKAELIERAERKNTWKRLSSDIKLFMDIEFPGIRYSFAFFRDKQEIKMYVSDGYAESVRYHLIESIIPITILLTVENL